jgi:hypothetical protein
VPTGACVEGPELWNVQTAGLVSINCTDLSVRLPPAPAPSPLVHKTDDILPTRRRAVLCLQLRRQARRQFQRLDHGQIEAGTGCSACADRWLNIHYVRWREAARCTWPRRDGGARSIHSTSEILKAGFPQEWSCTNRALGNYSTYITVLFLMINWR